jgi:arylsulfatase A-like enzyme
MKRRDFIKLSGMSLAAQVIDSPIQAETSGKPNIIVIIADQRHYGLSKATGYKFDTSPCLDRMQSSGVAFKNNYCTSPICVASRISMLTGRWPNAHHVRMNLQPEAAFYSEHIFQVARRNGYRTCLAGKNHTFMRSGDVDVWREYTHEGGYLSPNAHPDSAAFEKWLKNLHSNFATEPSPYPLETQLTYRIVSDALDFIDEKSDKPFFMEVSIPEPHDPEQVPAPYWNMFPPDQLPERPAGAEALKHMGPRARWEYALQQDHFPETDPQWRRYLSNYLGSLRLIDDQIDRLVQHLKKRDLTKQTLVVFTTDHGDYLMHYGLGRKGVGLYEDLVHTPMIWWGFGVQPNTQITDAFTSMADLMPTLCEAIGTNIPEGVQGRSLWPLLRNEAYPKEEFRSIVSGVGIGGLYYENSDNVPTTISHDSRRPHSWDELNKVTQSGNQKMVRMREWKLVYDMMGYGQLYNLKEDPYELQNLFGNPKHEKIQADLMAELAMWVIRIEDNLPTGPQNGKYQTKWPQVHNWYAPYRRGGNAPNPYVP